MCACKPASDVKIMRDWIDRKAITFDPLQAVNRAYNLKDLTWSSDDDCRTDKADGDACNVPPIRANTFDDP